MGVGARLGFAPFLTGNTFPRKSASRSARSPGACPQPAHKTVGQAQIYRLYQDYQVFPTLKIF
jgi:hypothetical protein